MSNRVWVPDKESPLLQVCLYRYAICKRKGEERCPVLVKMPVKPDLTQWIHAVDKVLKCSHVGDELTVKQWAHRRMGKSETLP